jgi:hypothetical protein
MRLPSRCLLTVLVLASLELSACSHSSHDAQGPAARVERIDGTNQQRVVLSAPAAERLGIQTARVRSVRATGDGEQRGRRLELIPYAAVLYAPDGTAFTYTSPTRLVYVRRDVDVDHISGGGAFLTRGPRPGTLVVTVGADELLGAETGVQGEQK